MFESVIDVTPRFFPIPHQPKTISNKLPLILDFGLSIKYPSDGVLQDVHWSEGLFGYFPTYSLGNVYAGCLFEAMQNQLPSLNKNLKIGNLSEATEWLSCSVHQLSLIHI